MRVSSCRREVSLVVVWRGSGGTGGASYPGERRKTFPSCRHPLTLLPSIYGAPTKSRHWRYIREPDGVVPTLQGLVFHEP